jgi:hypothetical protein
VNAAASDQKQTEFTPSEIEEFLVTFALWPRIRHSLVNNAPEMSARNDIVDKTVKIEEHREELLHDRN